MKAYTDPAKIKRLIDYYVREVRPGYMPFKCMEEIYGLTPNAIRYQLRKAGVWVKPTKKEVI
jgi:hypothetical protein